MSEDMEEIYRIFGKKPPILAQEKYLQAMKQVLPYGYKIETVPWEKVMPVSRYEELSQIRNEEEKKIFEEIGDDIKYLEIYNKTSSVFSYFEPAKANLLALKHYHLNGEGEQFLGGYQPDKNGFYPVPKYSLSETITGRMKVTSGPNALLLPKKMRNVYQSRFGKEGSLWILDFVSLEPRVLLTIKQRLLSLLIGNVPQAEIIEELPEDIYSYSLKRMKLSAEIDRNRLKQIVLPQIYGQAKSLTIENLEEQGVRGPDEVVDLVNDFFGIDMVRSHLQQEMEKVESRYLKTLFGRHLSPDDSKPHVILNYYIQSLAVDIALLGFERICNKIKNSPAKDFIKPIACIHDALILDIHNEMEHLVPKLCKVGESLPFEELGGQKFYLSGNKMI